MNLVGKLGLGRIAYRTVFRPIGAVRQTLREGGPWEQRRTREGHEAMKLAARELPLLVPPPEGPSAEIAYLSGPRFWHQTLFCFVSFQLVTPFRVTPVIYDDGGLDRQTMDHILRVVPWARFVMANELEAKLDQLLPESAFPSLRARRRVYPHLRKLTDIHVGSRGFTLVADSDMLFYRRSNEICAWFYQPQAIYLQDIETAYGYPLPFMGGLAGAEVPEPVNVGLYALDGAVIDWSRVEIWCRRQLESYGSRYVQEQALTAMLFGRAEAHVLSREDYVVMPQGTEGTAPKAVLHHYVDTSKHAYFRHGWREIMARAQAAARN